MTQMASDEGASSSPARRRPARVLAVDDDPSFLALLCDVVEAASELELVGESADVSRRVKAALLYLAGTVG